MQRIKNEEENWVRVSEGRLQSKRQHVNISLK